VTTVTQILYRIAQSYTVNCQVHAFLGEVSV